jgi:sugar O-acyltransferase (sialic acid O-acetyltransferase NeuD family)
MKNLLIIGARGFGREVYCLAIQCSGFNVDYRIKGFLDSNSLSLDGFQNYPKIICDVENYDVQENDVFVCALGSVKWKKYYTEIIRSKGGEFFNLIHPTVNISQNVYLGVGLIIFMNSIISNDTFISDFVTIQSFVAFGHDTKIGKWCHFNAYSFLGGFTTVEDEVMINTRATILPNLIVKKGATVGAGSVVIKNVPEHVTVFGIPAKKLEY